MAIRMQDAGEVAYGGLVTLTKYLDNKRIEEGKLANKEEFKKYSTYAYLLPGAGATLMSAFGVWRRYESWLEHISHGFMYAFPGWLTDVVTTMSAGSASKSRAVAEAQRLTKGGGGGGTARTYQQEFKKVVAW